MIYNPLIFSALCGLLGASSILCGYFRAAAAQLDMNATDLQVIDILEITGPATAGQLAELAGLTTGAITGMISERITVCSTAGLTSGPAHAHAIATPFSLMLIGAPTEMKMSEAFLSAITWNSRVIAGMLPP
jgi:hypothetical protein